MDLADRSTTALRSPHGLRRPNGSTNGPKKATAIWHLTDRLRGQVKAEDYLPIMLVFLALASQCSLAGAGPASQRESGSARRGGPLVHPRALSFRG